LGIADERSWPSIRFVSAFERAFDCVQLLDCSDVALTRVFEGGAHKIEFINVLVFQHGLIYDGTTTKNTNQILTLSQTLYLKISKI
jgi:hypothetical protein